MMRDNHSTHSHWHFRKKGFPWVPLFVIYIGILLIAALLSGIVAKSARRTGRDQAQQNQEKSAQISAASGAGAEENGNGSNAPSGQNGGQAGTARGNGNGQTGNGQTGSAQGGGRTDQGGEVTIGDSYNAPDRQNQPVDQQNAPAVEAPVDPNRIEVESISITSDMTWMRQGESVQLYADIDPDNATDPSVQWRSNNEGVAVVSSDGVVTSVGGGPVVISAISSNGLVVDFPMDVSTKEKWMLMTVSRSEEYNDYVGDNWDFSYEVNGVPVSDSEDMLVVLGDTITVTTTITENDDNPDVGMTQGSFTVDEMSFANGFEMEQEIFVRENEDEIGGDEDETWENEAAFLVTYSFVNSVN